MRENMGVIENYIKQYGKEYEFYKQLASIAHDVLESEIINRGIKALVSHRAKRVDRLKEKLEKRNAKQNYKSKRAIEKDIIDLAGLRVALYFPSERDILDQVINELFEVVETKVFPENPHEPKHNKRFSGYWATHYRVKLKSSDETEKRFTDTIFEIQVASVLMHAWSEVEHDLVYKPLSGQLSDDELAILDEINGLVIAGEIALERLQKAITERTKKQTEITDKYELTSLLFNNLKGHKWSKQITLGNTQLLANYLKAVEKIPTSEFNEFINNINFDNDEPVTDQLLNSLLYNEHSSDVLQKYFSFYTSNKKKASGFECFVKNWVLFEKIISHLNYENGSKFRNPFIPSLKLLTEKEIFSKEEIQEIHHLRRVRNELLHGRESIPNDVLEEYYNSLRRITLKAIGIVEPPAMKNQFIQELNEIK